MHWEVSDVAFVSDVVAGVDWVVMTESSLIVATYKREDVHDEAARLSVKK
jgi:hypothetical protein